MRRRLLLEALEPRQVLAVAVESLTPNPSGFVAQFTNPIDSSVLNLYDSQSAQFGAADVTLRRGDGTSVPGSIISEGNRLTFIATGGVLPADTYTVTLRSASNAIRDQALNELLDGEFNGTFPSGNGIPGGDFVFTFVAAPQSLVISLPDFSRGPTQALNVPAQGSNVPLPEGLPVRVQNAAGVTSLAFRLRYDPSLLELHSVELGPDAPEGSQVVGNFTTAGEAILAFFSLEPLTNQHVSIIKLVGQVPEDAAYGAAHVLQLDQLEVNAGALQATADSAIHVVAFPGDANKNRRYDAEDARLVARVGVQLDSGFAADPPTQSGGQIRVLYPTIDPVLIGDVTGQEGLSALDASDILRRVVGLPTPNIPPLPSAQAPFGLALSSTSIAEGLPIGTTVGSLTTSDPDVNETHTYTFADGPGDDDNASFTLDGNLLKTAEVFNHEVKSSYSIRIRTTDPTNRFHEQSFVITIVNVNEAPTAIAISNQTVAENQPIGTLVGTFTTTDPDSGDTHTYTLVVGQGDDDNELFAIQGNQLRTAAVLDHETQATLSVRVRSTDAGGLFFERIFTITVSNVNEAPIVVALSNQTVNENEPVGTLVGTFITTDPDVGDTHTYELIEGEGDDDNDLFTIDGDELRTAAIFDHETQSTLTIRVRSTDAQGLSVERSFLINVGDVNEAPTAIALSSQNVMEDQPVGTLVGIFTTTDPDAGDTHTYTLVVGEGDTDNELFTITGNELRTAAVLELGTLNIRVRSTDGGDLSIEQTFTINVTNVNEAPTAIDLSNQTVTENEPVGTVVGTFSTTDPDAGDTHTYTLVTGEGDTDNELFTIEGNELRTAAVLDHETHGALSIRVRSTDAGGLSTEQTFVIQVGNVNEAPTAIGLSNQNLEEDQPAGTLVGIFTTTDPDVGDTHTYELVAGEGDDNELFVIEGNELRTVQVLDLGNYTIRVRSTDGGDLSIEQTFTINVTNVNEAPTAIDLSNQTVAENEPVGTVVGTFSTTDPDAGDTHTYTLVTGEGDTDNALFTIEGNELRTAAVLDHETQGMLFIRIRSTDAGGLSTEQTFTIQVTNVNEAPTAIALSNQNLAEDQPAGTLVGLFTTTDPDVGDSHTYTFVAGEGDADNELFVIDGNELRTAQALDLGNYNIRVRSTDGGDLSIEQTFTINVTNVNEAPTAIDLSNQTVAENEPVGTVVGTFSTTDPDVGDTHTYELVAGEGDTDNALFTIEGNELRTAAVLDHETQGTLFIRVRSTDAGGLSTEETFAIQVANVNEAPTAITLSNQTLLANPPIGTLVGTLTTTDPDAGDTHTYELVAGEGDTDNALFAIDGDELRTAAELEEGTFSVRIRSTDADGLFVEELFTITVTS